MSRKNIGDFAKFNKVHIKYLLFIKRKSNKRIRDIVDIAILLDNNQYIEYSMSFKQSFLTIYVANRIKDLFANYYIDETTDVMVNDLLDEAHPLHLYLKLLRPHVQFKFRPLNIDKIVNRIFYYFTGKTSTKTKFNFVWKTAIEHKTCPWITQQVDYALQNKGGALQRHLKTLRLGMLYMVVKNYMYKVKCKHELKKKMKMQQAEKDAAIKESSAVELT